MRSIRLLSSKLDVQKAAGLINYYKLYMKKIYFNNSITGTGVFCGVHVHQRRT